VRRREILKLLGFAGIGCAALEPAEAATAPQTDHGASLHVYICAPDDVMGVLIAKDVLRHQKFIEDLRKRHHYYISLRFGSTNRYMEPFCLDVLKHFFSDPDLTFIARARRAASSTNPGSRIEQSGSVDIVGQQLRDLIGAGLALRPASERSLSKQYFDISIPRRSKRDRLANYLENGSNRLLPLPEEQKRGFPIQSVPACKKHPAQRRPAPDNLAQLATFFTVAVRNMAYAPRDAYLHDKYPYRQAVIKWIDQHVAFDRTAQNATGNPKFKILLRGQG